MYTNIFQQNYNNISMIVKEHWYSLPSEAGLCCWLWPADFLQRFGSRSQASLCPSPPLTASPLWPLTSDSSALRGHDPETLIGSEPYWPSPRKWGKNVFTLTKFWLVSAPKSCVCCTSMSLVLLSSACCKCFIMASFSLRALWRLCSVSSLHRWRFFSEFNSCCSSRSLSFMRASKLYTKRETISIWFYIGN